MTFAKLSISIHSLVKRETIFANFPNNDADISIHSLVKRETSILKNVNTVFNYFNPLPRKEGDGGTVSRVINVSADFNPLPRKEGDRKYS